MKLEIKHIFNSNGNDKVAIIRKLKAMGLFNDFTKRELLELSNIVYIRHYKKDEIIFQENRPGLGMYFIQEGTVKIVKESHSNGYDQSAILGPGDTLGEDSLFS